MAVGAGALLALSLSLPRSPPRPLPTPPAPAQRATFPFPSSPARCPSGSLPDRGLCLPVRLDQPEPTRGETLALTLLPGRPEDPARYALSVVGRVGAPPRLELSSHPSDDPPAAAEWLVALPPGTEIRALELESSVGVPRSTLTATPERQLLTLHHVEKAGSRRSYVVAYSGIDVERLGAAAAREWTEVNPNIPLGRISAGPSPSGLRFAVRQLRRGIQIEGTAPERLLRDSHSVPCDPRNVLPLRP